MKDFASLCLLLYIFLLSSVVVEAQTIPTASINTASPSPSPSVHTTSTPVPPTAPPAVLHELNLLFLAIIPVLVVLLGIICGSLQCYREARKRWRRNSSWSAVDRGPVAVVNVASGEVAEGGGGGTTNVHNSTQNAEQNQSSGGEGRRRLLREDPRYLVLPAQPTVVSELVTPLLSSEEHGLGGGEETELQQLSATGRRPYETVVRHMWTDSPPSATEDDPVTVFNLTAKNRAEQPVAQAPPTPLKPCMALKGRPSGQSTISSVSYVYPESNRSGSNASSNQSQAVSSHSYESLDYHRKPVSANGRRRRQVRIVAPEDEQDEVSDNSMQVSYDDVLVSGADMGPFEDVIDEEDGYDVVKESTDDQESIDDQKGAGKLRSKAVSKDKPEYPYSYPPAGEVSICEHLRQGGHRTISRDNIHIIRQLGEGFFSTVYEGTWRLPLRDVKVAVKKANNDLEEKEKVKFLQEAAVIGQFSHPHIIKLFGVIMEDDTTGEPCAIVLEFLPHGDLKQHLRRMKKHIAQENPREICRKLLQFCRQVASGMDYLSRKKFVHRDLAARNILLDRNYVCKIGDFGLSRDLEEENYYRTGGGVIAWKWTAPEALKFGKFSTASDVWSFGCVLYEMWSLGQTPMANVEQSELVYMLHRAYRMPPPPGCPRGMYKLMIDCWHPERSKRPSFAEVYSTLMQSEDSLLQPSTFDHSQLGSDELTESTEQYMDLQQKYYNQVT